MAKQSAIQKNLNRETLINRLKKKRELIKKTLMDKSVPFEDRIKAVSYTHLRAHET